MRLTQTDGQNVAHLAAKAGHTNILRLVCNMTCYLVCFNVITVLSFIALIVSSVDGAN